MASATRHISVAIERNARDVYDYMADPHNMSKWATGLAGKPLEFEDGHWVASSPMGRVTVEFTEQNSMGVLDHIVTLSSGEAVLNAVRVIPDGDDESEIVFTIRKRNMTDTQFEADTQAVVADLKMLKTILEA